RTQHGFTLQQVADALNMNATNLSKVETGKRAFDAKRLAALCKLYNLDETQMKKKLLSEKIAKDIQDSSLDKSVPNMAEQKINGYTESRDGKADLTADPDLFGNEEDWRLKAF